MNIWNFFRGIGSRTNLGGQDITPKKIFVSYTEADQALVEHIVAGMRDRGHDVWFAPKDLVGGDRLSTISQKIEWAEVAVVLLSTSAINSRWVQHELSIAVALHLDGRSLQIIPVCIDGASRPASIADFVSVAFDRRDYDGSVASLLAAIDGERSGAERGFSAFLEYVKSLPVVDENTLQKVYSNTIHVRSAVTFIRDKPNASVVDLMVARLDRDNKVCQETTSFLIGHGVTADQCRTVWSWMQGKHPLMLLPIVTPDDRSTIFAWHRTANDNMLHFAASLWREQNEHHHSCGITIRWITETFFAEYNCYASLLDNPEEASWKARDVIVPDARRAGLLAESTERLHPGTHAYNDAKVNPGFDFGPMVHVVGRVAALWELAHEKLSLRAGT